MSSRVESTITCPYCSHKFSFTLYRSIWGEYPDNRELVMTNKINVASCPACKSSTKLNYPFIYTNSKLFFAVWWEPYYDTQIDKDAIGYAKMLGEESYLAKAPRIADWDEFKNTILKFERGDLKGQLGSKSNEMAKQVEGTMKQLLESTKKKPKSGCLLLALLLFFTSIACLSSIILL
jgi:hypothetical protein